MKETNDKKKTMSGQTTAMVSGGLPAVDPEHGDWQQVFRYTQNCRTGLSGFPLILNTRAVFENACNRNYDDYQDGYIKKYDYPDTYYRFDWKKIEIDNFVNRNMGQVFKYYLLEEGGVYTCREVKLEGIHYDPERRKHVLLFNWTTNRSYIP
jgi:hypothetical protein